MVYRDEKGRFAKRPRSDLFAWGLTMGNKVAYRAEGDRNKIEITYTVEGYDYKFKIIMEKKGQSRPPRHYMFMTLELLLPTDHLGLIPEDCMIWLDIMHRWGFSCNINGREYRRKKYFFTGTQYLEIRNRALKKTKKTLQKIFSQMIIRRRIRDNAGDLWG